MSLLHKSLLYTLVLLIIPTLASAQKIYHWTDDDGRTHYSTTPPMKPVEEKQLHIIKMKTPVVVKKEEENVNKTGKELWDSICSTCHNLSATRKNGLRGIQGLIIDMNNPSTGFESTVQIVQSVIDNNMNDMGDMEQFNLSADDVRNIAGFIVDEVSKNSKPKK